MSHIVGRLLPSTSFDSLRQFARLSRTVPYEKKILWNALPYSGYAYCLLHACRQARALGFETVAAIELGVAGGNGLLALERHALQVERVSGVTIETFGFDTGEGLLKPTDARDMPYYFARGDYQMDPDLLRERLVRSQLVLGDVRQTFPRFLHEQHCPIAFIAFDMDYYHPTRTVLNCLADQRSDSTIPRPYLYFDNTVGSPQTLYNEFAGELLAIDEFNRDSTNRKIARDRSFLGYHLNFPWYHKVYILHQFDHPLYSQHLEESRAEALTLKTRTAPDRD